jgi:hypothetical protein
MKRPSLSLLCAFLCLSPLIACAVARDSNPPEKDPAVQQVVDGVSRERLEKTVRALAAFPTRHTLSGAKGADAAALWLEKEFQTISRESGGRLTVERDTWTQPAGNRMPQPHDITNVVATLPGTETPERVIVISGHYDSRVTDVMDATSPAPGANDDASGVAVVLELARQMAGRKYPCTVIFAAVTGEEQGLYGSAHLAERLNADKRNIIAMFDNDIVGNSRGQDGAKDDKRVRVFSAGYNPGETPAQASRRRAWGTDADTPARTLARALWDSAHRYVKGFEASLVYRNDRYGRGGDHTPFLNLGYAAVRLTEPNEDWRHQHQDLRTEKGVQYGDLPEFVDYAYLARVTKVNAAAVAELASAPAAPETVTIKGDLDPKTTLTWKAGANAAGCEILWRQTTAPDWEGIKRVPREGTLTLPQSKDDYLFAVRAVSASGARSLPAIPVGGR